MNNSLILPFYYGTIAQQGLKKIDNRFHYKWIAFVRGPNNEDLSPIIKSVIFQLHESFENSYREINKYPFILEELGWGEFDLKITINLNEEYSKYPINLTHLLRFHPTKTSKKAYLYQNYDEIILTNPTESLINSHKLLINKDDELMELLCNKYGYENKEMYQYLLAENVINFKQHEDYLTHSIEYIDQEIKNSLNELMNMDKKIEDSNLLEKRDEENF